MKSECEEIISPHMHSDSIGIGQMTLHVRVEDLHGRGAKDVGREGIGVMGKASPRLQQFLIRFHVHCVVFV